MFNKIFEAYPLVGWKICLNNVLFPDCLGPVIAITGK